MRPAYEYCIECGDLTGRAGDCDDSLYVNDAGPFCETCYQYERLRAAAVRVLYAVEGTQDMRLVLHEMPCDCAYCELIKKVTR